MTTLTIYSTGTLTFTNGSTALTGVGTSLIGLKQGDPIMAPDGHWYELAADPTDNLAATLDRNYAGTTATNSPGGSGWTIFRSSVSRDSVRTGSKQLTDISSVWRQIMSLTQSDQLTRLSKTTTTDHAGMILAKALVDMFQIGTFEDDDLSIRYLVASTWTKALAVNSATGATSIFAQLLLGNTIAPAQITADTNDYAPANLSQANLLRVSTDASHKLTGLTGGSAGRVLALMNTGATDLVLAAESTASVAANRFGLHADMTIPGGNSTLLIYDGATSRWRPMGGQGGVTFTVGTVTSGSSPSVTITGSTTSPTLNFVLQKGADGANGTNGTNGANGAAATISIGTVTTGTPGSSAAVSNGGTSNAASLNFTIPQGNTGATGAGYGGSSTTSLTIGMGSQSFTTQAGLAYSVSNYVRLASTANAANFIEGAITAYDSVAGAMTINVTKIGGSGTIASWNLSLAGAPGTGDMLSTNNLREITDKAAARANIGVLKKNYLLNAAMMISQENGLIAGTTSGYYPVDQWSIQTGSMGSGTFSAGQVASISPAGSPNRIRVTVTAAQTTVGSSVAWLQQKMEGNRVADLAWGTAGAKNLTFQMGVKAPVAGTYTLQVVNGAQNASVAGTFTIAAGEVNTDVVKTVTIAGVTSGTWATDNTTGIMLEVFLMTTSQTANIFATNGNVFELFDAGAYEGSTAPAFQVPNYSTEFLECLKYYYKGLWSFRLSAVASGIYVMDIPFKVPMRAAPTMSLSGTARSNLATNSFVNTDIHQTALQVIASAAGDMYIYGETLIANARM